MTRNDEAARHGRPDANPNRSLQRIGLARPRRTGALRRWLDANVGPSRVWDRLERESVERLQRYARGDAA